VQHQSSHAGGDQRRVPVQAAIVGKKDYPVFLQGLGTVQATNTVVVRSRVDGQIDKLAFKQGQIVLELHERTWSSAA
jgi:multidrug efflux system membrane fusion protein